MITLAEFILDISEREGMCYNGHCMLTVSNMDLNQALEVCKDLQELDPMHSYVVELWTDGGMNIYCKDCWKLGERHDGQTDKLILGIGE